MLDKSKKYILLLLLGSFYWSCVSSQEQSFFSLTKEIKFHNPSNLKDLKDLKDLPSHLSVNSSIMNLSFVRYPHCELREGPSQTFKVTKLLNFNDYVLVLKNHGVWRKVLQVKSDKSDYKGWIHHKLLYPVSNNNDPIILESKHLSIVHLNRPVFRIISLDHSKQYDLNLPQGASFLLLKQNDSQSLVWMPQVKIVAWLDNNSLD